MRLFQIEGVFISICTHIPGLASGFSIHHDDLPVPSFCTLIKRLWSDKLCLIEFCKRREGRKLITISHTHLFCSIVSAMDRIVA